MSEEMILRADAVRADDIRWRDDVIDAALAPAIDLNALLAGVERFLRRYVVLTDDQAAAVTLWNAHTHVFAAAECTPYLRVASATPRSGKTRLLEVMETVTRNPWLTGRTSAAALT